MTWDKVGGGELDGGDSYLIERHVIYLQVPKAGNTVLPIRLRSYRWRVVRSDGTSTVQATAKSRTEIDVSVRAFGVATQTDG